MALSKGTTMKPSIGHNSSIAPESRDQLRSIVDRIEGVEAQKKALSDDIKDLYSEARGAGYDVAAIRVIVARRKKDAAKLQELEDIVDVYMNALGMLSDTPLGQSAIQRATAAHAS